MAYTYFVMLSEAKHLLAIDVRECEILRLDTSRLRMTKGRV